MEMDSLQISNDGKTLVKVSDTSLQEVVIPNTVTEIGNSAFYGCETLEEIELPDSIETIGDNLFAECDKLARIIIPIGSKSKFETLLPDHKEKLIEQEDGWTVKKTRYFDAEEMALVALAEVVPTPNGRSVCFFMMSGGKTNGVFIMGRTLSRIFG